jgi:hypothetical protein
MGSVICGCGIGIIATRPGSIGFQNQMLQGVKDEAERQISYDDYKIGTEQINRAV